MKIVLIPVAVVLLACFSALTTTAQTSVRPIIIRSVKPERVPNKWTERAIASAVEFDDSETRYYYNYVDLNGDRIPEVLVFVFGREWCGTGGCDAFLFQKRKGVYNLVTHFEPVRNPIIVSETKTKGWKDLIFYNSGGGIIPGYYSRSKFNGSSYLENPTVERDSPPMKRRFKGTEYLAGPYGPKDGLLLVNR